MLRSWADLSAPSILLTGFEFRAHNLSSCHKRIDDINYLSLICETIENFQ